MTKKILVISPSPSHPQTAGNRRRMTALTQKFQRCGFQIHYIWYALEYAGALSGRAYADMCEAWDQVHVVPAQNSGDGGLDALVSPSLLDLVNWCFLNNDYDILLCNYTFLSKVFLAAPDTGVTKILDTHDCLSQLHETYRQRGAKNTFYHLTEEQEAEALARADIVIGIQEEDSARFEDLAKTPVLTISHLQGSLSIPPRTPTEADVSAKTPPKLGLIGSLNDVSIDNTRLFLDAFLKADTGFDLIIAGALAQAFSDLDHPSIHLIGPVDAVEDFYAMIDMVVVPMDFGSGQKIKAVEALASGLPVLATQHAFIGIPSTEKAHQFGSIAALVSALGTYSWRHEISALGQASAAVWQRYQARVDGQFDTLLQHVSEQRAAHHPMDGDHLRDLSALPAGRPIIIYGAGIGGVTLLDAMSDKQREDLLFFVDKNKAGTKIQGHDIIAPDDAIARLDGRSDCLLLISIFSADRTAVAATFRAAGLHDLYFCHHWIIDHSSLF